jgi:hypothetical protein
MALGYSLEERTEVVAFACVEFSDAERPDATRGHIHHGHNRNGVDGENGGE